MARLNELMGCGCAGVVVHDCLRFNELVTLRAVGDRGRQTLQQQWTSYRGRDCQTCVSAVSGKALAAGELDVLEPTALPQPLITRRNLLYHVCPLRANDLWRRNCDQVRRRLDLFNGRRLVAIAVSPRGSTGSDLLSSDFVRDALPGCEYIEVTNDRRLREVASLPRLLAAIANTNPHEASFFAHSKGNCTLESNDCNEDPATRIRGATRWRNAMYAHLLDPDRWPALSAALRRYPTVGTTKITWTNDSFRWPSGAPHVGSWMFAGTFFWFRHDRVFSLPNWSAVPHDRYGAEAWPGMLFPSKHGYSIYQPWPGTRMPAGGPYAPHHYGPQFDDP